MVVHENPEKLMKRMSRDHLDVLQNIEHVLVTSWRDDPSIDDAVVEQALRAAIRPEEAGEARSGDIVAELAGIRKLRTDIGDDVWHAALRTVLQSVERHSTRRPGQTAYLRFVSPFIV